MICAEGRTERYRGHIGLNAQKYIFALNPGHACAHFIHLLIYAELYNG